MASIKFGTDGWRGIIGEDFTFQNIIYLTEALSNHIKNTSETDPNNLKVIIGYDTRFLSKESASLISRVLADNSIHVSISNTPIPTPVVSFTTLKSDSDYGIIVTASHNPGIWNGIKIKDSQGNSITEKEEESIEKEISKIKLSKSYLNKEYTDFNLAEKNGLINRISPLNNYIKQLKKLVDVGKIRSSKMIIVADCMHGTASGILPSILGLENISLTEINNQGNPLFPGMKQPEPIKENLSRLSDLVKKMNADIGLAFDADADRLGIIDENGNYIDTPYLFCMIADHVIGNKNKSPIVSTITMSSMIDKLASFHKVESLRTKIGFKNVAPIMKETDSFIGGEESGGFAYSKHLIERDGIMSALLLLEALTCNQKQPSELLKQLNDKLGHHYYKRIDVPIQNEETTNKIRKFMKKPNLSTLLDNKITKVDKIDGVKINLENGDWIALRLSGTEPLIRLYSESSNKNRLDPLVNEILKKLELSIK